MILYVVTAIWIAVSLANIVTQHFFQPDVANAAGGIILYAILTVAFGGLSAFFMEKLGIKLEQKD